MDFETFVESLFGFIKNSENYYFLFYALATCLLSQVAKKLFVNKVKVDVQHKFDWAVVFPFAFGLLFAAVDMFAVRKAAFCVSAITQTAVDGATIGALATVIFKFLSGMTGKSLKSLMKDDIFGVFYTQLLYFGNARKRLADGTLTLADFIGQVRLVATNATEIYADAEMTDEVKREKLGKLLSGIVQDSDINACTNVINRALIARQSDLAQDKK